MRPLLALATGLLGSLVALAAGEPSSEPILRIETGFHTTPIRRVDAAQDGTILTVSDDKTARLWRVEGSSFIQEQVLRVPIGPGNEGKLSAGAISPDGRWVAVGGWTKGDGTQGHFISLFNRRTGALVRRLGPVPNVILHLRFRPDGQALVACLGGNNGIRVFDPATGHVRWEDRAYGAASYGACWLPDGGLAATSDDGHIRAYDAQGRQRWAVTSPLGKQPCAIATDGAGTLAVGFADSTAVARLRVGNGQALDALDTAGVAEGTLSSVAWQAGQWWAGGRFQSQEQGTWIRPTLHWTPQGRQTGAGPLNIIMDLQAQPGNTRLVVGAADPQVLLLDAQGQAVARRAGVTADLRAQHDVLAVAEDARQVRFGLQVFGKTPLHVDAEAGALVDSPSAPAGCATARIQAPGWEVQGWKSTTTPTLNGTRIALEPYERARSLAIAPNGQMAVLGTEWSLRALDRQGQELWRQDVPDVAWAVVASGDGRSVIVGYGDGTIRWHRLRDGKEYLALFVHAGDRRWVLWTPSGYYWASPGGEDLIGWHINRFTGGGGASRIIVQEVTQGSPADQGGLLAGDVIVSLAGQAVATTTAFRERLQQIPEGKARIGILRDGMPRMIDATPRTENGQRRIGITFDDVTAPCDFQTSDFFPASRFRSRFNRPEVVRACFDTLDEAAALAQVGAKDAPALATILPPVVTIEDPAGGSAVSASPVTLRYRVRSPTGKPVTRLQVLVDGVETDIGAERGMKRVISNTTTGDAFTITVPVPAKDCGIALIASTTDGASEPAQVRLRWAGAAAAPALADLPACYVLAMGVSTYQIKDLTLTYPTKDVQDIAAAFQAQAGKLYRVVTPKVLADPTKVQILDGFDWLAKQCTNRDLAVIAIAGHGEVDQKGTYYLLPADADPTRLRATAVPHSDLVRSIQDLPCKKLAFLDTCHAGAVQGGGRRRGAADASELINTLADPETGCIMFCAATGRQPSQEKDEWRNGAFSKAVVEALTGTATGVTDPVLTAILSADKLTHARLNTYVAERVKQLTDGQQTPTYAAPSTVPDFPVAVRK